MNATNVPISKIKSSIVWKMHKRENYEFYDYLENNWVNILTKLWAGWPGNWGWIPNRGREFYLLYMSRPNLGPKQPPIHWVLEASVTDVEWLGVWSWLLIVTSTEVMNAWTYTSPAPFTFMVQLYNYTLLFIFYPALTVEDYRCQKRYGWMIMND
jgi:hypothetical protein